MFKQGPYSKPFLIALCQLLPFFVKSIAVIVAIILIYVIAIVMNVVIIEIIIAKIV